MSRPSQLRKNLYKYFPDKRQLVDEAFREYYAFWSDDEEKVEKEVAEADIGAGKARKTSGIA